jgi:uncharacterized protein YerC
MQTSSQALKKETEENILIQLATLIADLKNPIETEQFLKDFLTETEFSVLAKRLAIFQMLKKKFSYQVIQDTLKVSSATISSVAEFKHTLGARVAEQKLTAEEWAEQTTHSLWNWLPGVVKK